MFQTSEIQTIFPISDDIVFRDAEILAVEAKTRHQYTDLNKFTIKCQQCNVNLVGQEEAIAHAKETGHGNFGEFTS